MLPLCCRSSLDSSQHANILKGFQLAKMPSQTARSQCTPQIFVAKRLLDSGPSTGGSSVPGGVSSRTLGQNWPRHNRRHYNLDRTEQGEGDLRIHPANRDHP
eukprot:3884428-Pleurochrysis_carterae.AAC.3